MTDRFAIRADRVGFSVYDTWTGETAVVRKERLAGLEAEDAARQAADLSQLERAGDRSIKQ
jgi:hypothetical protein